MRKDDISINEAYSRVYQQTEVLEEGIFDRAKANITGAMKGIAPAKRLGALAAKGLGKVAGKFSSQAGEALQKTGEGLQKSASEAGIAGKINSIMGSHTGSIKKVAQEIINDLDKLNLNPKNLTADQFASQLTQDLTSYLSSQLPESQVDVSGIEVGATVKDKEGNTYRYTSPSEVDQATGKLKPSPDGASSEGAKWYELSGGGKSAYEIAGDSDDLQKSISVAFKKQGQSQPAAQEEKPKTPEF
jgi:hypothetical protein